MKLNKYIDHTLLKQDATEQQIDRLLSEAREYDFASVCVNPCWVAHAKSGLENTDVKVCTVVGFPLGATTSAVKAYETKEAIQNGADEIDMVINVGALKSGNAALVESDIRAVVEASGDKLVKVIIEACLLTDEEKVLACQLAQKAGVVVLNEVTYVNFSLPLVSFETSPFRSHRILILLLLIII